MLFWQILAKIDVDWLLVKFPYHSINTNLRYLASRVYNFMRNVKLKQACGAGCLKTHSCSGEQGEKVSRVFRLQIWSIQGFLIRYEEVLEEVLVVAHHGLVVARHGLVVARHGRR